MTEKMKTRCRRAALATMMSLAVGAFSSGAGLASRADGYQAAIKAGAAASAAEPATADAGEGGAAKEAQQAAFSPAALAA